MMSRKDKHALAMYNPKVQPKEILSNSHSAFIYRCLSSLLLVNSTQTISGLLPLLTANTDATPKDIVWIDSLLDLQEPFIIGSPKCLLKVGFVPVGLEVC